MPRNWQGIFQKGQPLENSTIANLQGLETDVASALATSGVTSVFTRSGAVTATSGDYTAAQVTNAADKSSGSTQTFTGNVSSPVYVASGITGATAASRYVGATASGAPASGTFALGDFVVAQNGHMFVCTVAGTPGTWVDVGSVANQVTSVFTRTGAVVATSGDYTAAQVTNAADKSSGSQQTFTGNVSAPVHIGAGITGATAASRYVGATASGAPSTGTFSVGDFVIAQNGHVFICTSAGTPGTWVDAGSVGNQVTSVFSRTGAVVSATNDYTDAQIQNSPTNILSATGDLLYASAANTLARLAVGSAGQRVVPISGLPAWRTAATRSHQPSDPAGTTSGTLVMCGTAETITPATTGNVLFCAQGAIGNTNVTTAFFALCTGTGSAPTNGAAVTGTQRTVTTGVTIATAAGKSPLGITVLVTGLTLGTAYWFDLAQAASAGTTTITGLTMSAAEV